MRSALAIVACVAAGAAALSRKDALRSLLMNTELSSLKTVMQPLPGLLFADPAPLSFNSTPCVLMHGLGDAGSNPGMQSLAASISKAFPGKYAVAVDVDDTIASFLTPMQKQVDDFAAAVKADANLVTGFDAIGLSQGGTILRGYVEQYNDPPVRNLITLSGVMNGVFNCPLEVQIFPGICELFEADPYAFNELLSFSEYFVLSKNESLYLSGNTFLPPLTGQSTINATYKTNFASLNKLILGLALNDTVVYPKESEQFGGYIWGTNASVFTMREAPFYINDTFGLRTLDEAGKVKLESFEGDHIRFSEAWWNAHVIPELAG